MDRTRTDFVKNTIIHTEDTAILLKINTFLRPILSSSEKEISGPNALPIYCKDAIHEHSSEVNEKPVLEFRKVLNVGDNHPAPMPIRNSINLAENIFYDYK